MDTQDLFQNSVYPHFPFDFAAFFRAVSSSGAIIFFKITLFFLSMAFFAGIIYTVVKITEINKKLHAKRVKGVHLIDARPKRLIVMEKHMESDNPAEWRLAIMEADALLEEMVKKMGYEGATLGEMLKNVEPSDFSTLNDAWEAHKIRNKIAHEGSSFVLTKREAKLAVESYEKVFREFGVG